MKPKLKSSPAARELIQRYEPFYETAQQGPDGRWVVGFGHRAAAKAGVHVSRDEASLLLIYDVMQAEEAINAAISAELTRPQRDALVSFVHGVGVAAFRQSDVARYLFEGRMMAAGEAIALHDGEPARREAESALFLTAFAPKQKPKPDAPVAGETVELVIKVEHPEEVAEAAESAHAETADDLAPPPPPPPSARSTAYRRDAEDEIARILSSVGALPADVLQGEADEEASDDSPVEALAEPPVEPEIELDAGEDLPPAANDPVADAADEAETISEDDTASAGPAPRPAMFAPLDALSTALPHASVPEPVVDPDRPSEAEQAEPVAEAPVVPVEAVIEAEPDDIVDEVAEAETVETGVAEVIEESVEEAPAEPQAEMAPEVETAIVEAREADAAEETIAAVEAQVEAAIAETLDEPAEEALEGPAGEITAEAAPLDAETAQIDDDSDAAARVIARMTQEMAATPARIDEPQAGEARPTDLPEDTTLGYVLAGGMAASIAPADDAADEVGEAAGAETPAAVEDTAEPVADPVEISSAGDDTASEPESVAEIETVQAEAEEPAAEAPVEAAVETEAEAEPAQPRTIAPSVMLTPIAVPKRDHTPPPHPAEAPAMADGSVGEVEGDPVDVSERGDILADDILAHDHDPLEEGEFSPQDLAGADVYVDERETGTKEYEGLGFGYLLVAALLGMLGAWGIFLVAPNWEFVWENRLLSYEVILAIFGPIFSAVSLFFFVSDFLRKRRMRRGSPAE